jgi:hypothetical protein
MKTFEKRNSDKKSLETIYTELVQLFKNTELEEIAYQQQLAAIIQRLKVYGHQAIHSGLVELLNQGKQIEDEDYLKKIMPFINELKITGMPKLKKSGPYEESDNALVAAITNQAFSEDFSLRLFKLLHRECRAHLWSKSGTGTLLSNCLYQYDREQIARYIIEQTRGKPGLDFLNHANCNNITALDLIIYKLDGDDQGKNFKATPLIKNTATEELRTLLCNKIRELKRELKEPIENNPTTTQDTSLRQRKSNLSPGSATEQTLKEPEKPVDYTVSALLTQFSQWLYSSPPKTRVHQGKVYDALDNDDTPKLQ